MELFLQIEELAEQYFLWNPTNPDGLNCQMVGMIYRIILSTFDYYDYTIQAVFRMFFVSSV